MTGTRIPVDCLPPNVSGATLTSNTMPTCI
jgi:hypothetical protein